MEKYISFFVAFLFLIFSFVRFSYFSFEFTCTNGNVCETVPLFLFVLLRLVIILYYNNNEPDKSLFSKHVFCSEYILLYFYFIAFSFRQCSRKTTEK